MHVHDLLFPGSMSWNGRQARNIKERMNNKMVCPLVIQRRCERGQNEREELTPRRSDLCLSSGTSIFSLLFVNTPLMSA
jgi:hypothetical protein